MAGAVNVYRNAAYALTQAGQAERAVEVLEAGRGREIAEWIADDVLELDRLVVLDSELAGRYRAAREHVQQAEGRVRRGLPVDVAALAPIAEELPQLAEAIRAVPTMERFGRPATFVEIAKWVPGAEAVIYPVTSRHGSIVLVVSGEPTPAVQVIHLPDLRQATTVEEALPLAASLGAAMMRPIASVLGERSLTTACIVPVGSLVRVPLHAMTWSDDNGQETCLLDHVEVVFAPSALARHVCRTRVERHGEAVDTAVVVGNPLPHNHPLDGADTEARMVAATLTAHDLRLLLNENATKPRVLTALSGADHVHLACHGQAASSGRRLDACVEMANGEPITGADLLDLDDFAPRLVVASACETGLVTGLQEADESLALSTTFIGAGAAGVIASLWAVNDLATALLMNRFYERRAAGLSPSGALRAAQLWLRDLTCDDERAYVDARAPLQAHRDAHDRRRRDTSDPNGLTCRWSDLEMWAAFTLAGA